MNNYEVGSIIKYRAFGGESRTVRVTEKDENIKDNRAGFCGIVLDASLNAKPAEYEGEGEFEEVWGYDYQITQVVKF